MTRCPPLPALLALAAVLATALGTATPAVAAAAATEATSPAARRYAACLAQARTDPAQAIAAASRWRDEGGGVAAKHCLALALLAQGQPKRAAAALEQAAQDMEAGRGLPEGMARGAVTSADLYGQAGNAALLAGDGARAYELLSRAVTQAEARPGLQGDLLIDRARAAAAMSDFAAATKDLDRAVGLLPGRPDAWLLRATARRKTGDLAGARTDIDAAVQLAPDEPLAYLERATIAALGQDMATARADWTRVIALAPDGPEAAIARENLVNAGPAEAAAPAGVSATPGATPPQP